VGYRETEPELPHKKQNLTHYFDPLPLHIHRRLSMATGLHGSLRLSRYRQ
jgi:hypothetical protein